MDKEHDHEHDPHSEQREIVSSKHQVGPIESHEEVRIIRQPGDSDDSVGPSAGRPVNIEHREHFYRDAAAERELRLHKTTQAVWWAVSIVEGLIALRILLRLIGANPENPFASFVYNLSALFLYPFIGLVANPASGGLVLEISSLIGMLVIAGVGWILVRLIWIMFEHTEARTSSTIDRYRK
jgi:hypothetical protein